MGKPTTDLHIENNVVPKGRWQVQPGQVFGDLIVDSEPFRMQSSTDMKNGKYRTRQCVHCKCSCGNIRLVRAESLLYKNVSMCVECTEQAELKRRGGIGIQPKDGKKVCSTCNTNLDLSCFQVSPNNKDRKTARCKNCLYADHVRRTRNIDIRTMKEILGDFPPECQICGDHLKLPIESPHRMEGVYMDHCHDTGRIRGILCCACNTSLGKMKDDPEILRKAADYLETADLKHLNEKRFSTPYEPKWGRNAKK